MSPAKRLSVDGVEFTKIYNTSRESMTLKDRDDLSVLNPDKILKDR